MFYRPGSDAHGLPHSPFKAIVAPRPIGWISTLDGQGRANLAPYSFFNAFSDAPPMVAFGSNPSKVGKEERKDSAANVAETGEFVVNIVSEALKDAMNITSQHFDIGVDEFESAGLEKAACQTVAAPRVAAAPAALECKLFKIIDLPGGDKMVLGEVTGVHFADEAVVDGRFDVTRVRTLARLGYRDYAVVSDVFELQRPDH